jgi:hypothetical protein
VAALRSDVKFLTFVLTTILKRLAENKTMSLVDVQDLLGEIEALDSMPDGGLDPNVLRGLPGVVKRVDEDHPDSLTFKIDADPLDRYRR